MGPGASLDVVGEEKTRVQEDEYGRTKKDGEGCFMRRQQKCIRMN